MQTNKKATKGNAMAESRLTEKLIKLLKVQSLARADKALAQGVKI